MNKYKRISEAKFREILLTFIEEYTPTTDEYKAIIHQLKHSSAMLGEFDNE